MPAQGSKEAIAEIQYTKAGVTPIIEVVVPHGTRLADAMKLHDFLSRDVISKLSPRGCTACTSGTHLIFREKFENVINVDLHSGKVIG